MGSPIVRFDDEKGELINRQIGRIFMDYNIAATEVRHHAVTNRQIRR